MKLLMCRPDYYGIKYEINPWMNINKKVDHNAAVVQWDALYKTILKCDAEVELVPPNADWPDMTFTANAGLLYQKKIILSHFKYKERQGEMSYFQAWFTEAGFETMNNPKQFFEGAGDALIAGEKLFAGFGFRSVRSFYEQAVYLDHQKLVYCHLINPYFYHLDTCFCPLNAELAIWYPPAFTNESQEKMKEQIELIPVIEDEAKRFACNAVVLNKNTILPTECPEITTTLQKRGFTVHSCNMSEFLKAGGASKCLTLRID